jgi:hypothetical protein
VSAFAVGQRSATLGTLFRSQEAPLAFGDEVIPRQITIEGNLTTAEPRFVACGDCVGCKMKSSCGSCLQCLLQFDAAPGAQLVCMHRICSAPTLNPKLVSRQSLVATKTAPTQSHSVPAGNQGQSLPLKQISKAQRSHQASAQAEKSKLTMNAQSLAKNDSIGYNIDDSVVTQSANFTAQGMSIL